MKKKIVQIISVDKRYKKEAYPSIANYNSVLNTYMTGQHIDIYDKNTKDNLTVDQMLGKEKLTDAQRKKFPVIINPEQRIYITHMQKLNLTQDELGNYEDPKSKALLDYYKLQYVVASNKEAVVPGTHYFYINDIEEEVNNRVSKKKLIYKAQSKIMQNLSIKKYRDLALLLNYEIAESKIDLKNSSDNYIQDQLLTLSEKYPEKVLECFNPSVEKELMILKAIDLGLIEKKGKGFFDGNQYLGDDIQSIIKFAQTSEGEKYRIRWSKHINEREPEEELIEDKEEKDENYFRDILGKIAIEIVKSNYDTALALYEQALVYKPNDKTLKDMKDSIDNLTKKIDRRRKL